ncbi:MAG: NADH-quinone oxidoreductase subunit NuoG [Deltaproteobacteria bacterium]|nr:NADH-quinone oxidoreductase subunit NuoG [Deltaproteobacteria bacterium]
MPRLTIDNRAIEVPAGTKVIQAAERLGIYIPRFCYHEALGAVGACRLCAVMFLDGPKKGLEMSCMSEARDGMVVSTDHPEAQEFRRYIIEWLMANHPHDCPVCDEGGQCLLQDMTVSGGHGRRRYHGLKRTYHDQDLGPFVAHEMNRCIHCWRCRRFYQEFAGGRDLGALQIGRRTWFGRQEPGRLASPFAGNIIDLCPTGVYTDKPSRYLGRLWDFVRAESVCPHCSLGCAITVNARYRQVARLEARPEPAVNGYFICDRGRYGYGFAQHPARPRQAAVDGHASEVSAALAAAAARLTQVTEEQGPGAVAGLGSGRLSLEAQLALARLCQEQGWPPPRFFAEATTARQVHEAARGLTPDLAVSLSELAQADFIVTVGVNPLAEAPMLALALRQAWRAGARVACLDPRPLDLPFPAARLPLAWGELTAALAWLAGGGQGDPPGETGAQLQDLATGLAQSSRPVVVCGTDLACPGLPAQAAALALARRAAGQAAGLFYALPRANALGAVLAAPDEPAAGDLLADLEAGRVKALLVVEADPLRERPDQYRWARAVALVPLLVVLDHVPTSLTAEASVFLPTTNLFEAPGASLVNQEGRLQFAAPVMAPGAPLAQMGGGSHPAHVFPERTPGGEPWPAASLLDELAAILAPVGEREPRPDGWAWLASRRPNGLPLVPGQRVLPLPGGELPPAAAAPPPPPGEGELDLILQPGFLPGDELAGYSPILAPGPDPADVALWLSPGLVGELGLAPDDRVRLDLAGGELVVPWRVGGDMHRRTVVLANPPTTAWQLCPARCTRLALTALQPQREV